MQPAHRTESKLPPLLMVFLWLLVSVVSPTAAAWGYLGHELAGTLAEEYLHGNTRARIRELLGNESLAEASTWADRMRSDPAPFWQEEAGPYHYVTIPTGKRYAQIGAPRQGDGITALTRFRRELQDPATPRPRQRLALRFAIHIVQDLQQPLHAGNGRDRGGNDIAVRVAGEPSNLHRVWDVHILQVAERSRDAWLHELSQRAAMLRPSSADPVVWVTESAALRETLYPPPRNLTEKALREYLPTAEQRLALAGLRTAVWLNETFDGARGRAAAEPQARPEERSWWQRLLDR